MNKEFLSACERGQTETAAILLDSGAKGRTEALKLASENGNTETLDMLLDRGIDVNIKNSWGFTALMELCFLRRIESRAIVGATLLLDRGADVNVKTKKMRKPFQEGTTALMMAVKESRSEYTDFVNMLLDRGADVNATDKFGNTALMLASHFASTEIVNILLDRGADVNATDKFGNTALIMACKWRGSKPEGIVSLLLKKGADVNANDRWKTTALMAASNMGRTKIVKILLERGADVLAVDQYGDTALSIASKNGYTEIVKLILMKYTILIIKKGCAKNNKPLVPYAQRETISHIASFF